MGDSNTAALAGEFLVAGELSRRGYLVSITMGKAKAIDIFASTHKGERIGIDVKASRYKTSWPVGKIDETLYYVFVSLQTEDKLRSDIETYSNTPPEYFIVSGKDAKKLVIPWKSMPGVKYSSLKEYKERWDILPPP